MKKILFIVLVTMGVFIPFTVVNAKTLAESAGEFIKEMLDNEDDIYNASVEYDDDSGSLDISWVELEGTDDFSMDFNVSGNTIEYDPGEITSYEKATEYTGKMMYFFNYILYGALRANGYSKEEITTTLSSAFEFNYAKNGIEMEEISNQVEFTEDGSTITVTPMRFKIDVSLANLTTGSEVFTPPAPATTIESFVNSLNSDEDLIKSYYPDGLLYLENNFSLNENKLVINMKKYNYTNHNHSVYFDNDVLEFEDSDFYDYNEAKNANEYHSVLNTIIMWALLNNGFTEEEINNAFESDLFNLNYDENGIEYKAIGDEVSFTNDNNETISVTPLSIKVDLAKAKLNRKAEEVVKNPKTGDSFINYVILFFTSIISFICLLKRVKE